MKNELGRRIGELRPRRTWSSVVSRGSAEVWRREDDVWYLPSPPEDFALPPALPWTEELRKLALSEYCANFDRYLEPNEYHEMDWPPQGFLCTPGSWCFEPPACSDHGEEHDDSCDECRGLDQGGTVVVDRLAEWDWTVVVRTSARETTPDGSEFETEVDTHQWTLGSTPVDPREVEYGPEKGSPYRAELMGEFWAVES